MLWCACAVAFFGFMRISEFTVRYKEEGQRFLTFGDIKCQDGLLSIILRSSKSSQSLPYTAVIPESTRSCCTVRAYLKYAALCNTSPTRPVFTFADGMCLTRQRLSEFLKRSLGKSHSSHSLRMGAATTASQCGVPIDQIRVLGRWKSDAYAVYVKPNIQQQRSWIQLMAG
ncbi:hypothetical protein RvY_10989 [Ramazzottius varieornatus]|uniref:Tyr recombinase domain-containing protein n=1 Tax=Ramazzottius varieornatus TaxID=947166 RepID=A0A1D1VGP3_RAMVA|nr:hypothetical protein RvY_10989 [Ramazzottius varieornatus]